MPRLSLTYRREVVEEIAAAFDLRPHNLEALDTVVRTLAGDYDPAVEQVLHMATGAGKTYLMAALIEYLRREGVHHVLVVTPGLVVQAKTVRNFTPGDRKYIAGADIPPVVATPGTLGVLTTAQPVLGAEPTTLYVFNIQQLIAPQGKDLTAASGDGVTRRGLRKDNEVWGNVFAELTDLDDLVIIADESHLYGSSAKAFYAALDELAPAARIGLTATTGKGDHVVFSYPLYKAIEDKVVKTPVLAFRHAGYAPGDEEAQLRDALILLDIKQARYTAWSQQQHLEDVRPVLFVTCESTAHAEQIASVLAGPSFLGDAEQVLRVDNTTTDDATRARLGRLDAPTSRVRAVVSVNMLKEGWDVKNIAVLCALRVSKSAVLTQQTMGRGLRLPFGVYADDDHINQLDIISHESYRDMLRDENVLTEFGLENAVRPGHKPVPADSHPGTGAGTSPSVPGAGGASSTSTASTAAENDPDAPADSNGATGNPNTDPGDGPATVVIRPLDVEVDQVDLELLPVTVEANPKYAQTRFLFPSTRMERETVPFKPSMIEDATLRTAGEKVSDSGEVIEREAMTLRSVKARTVLGVTTVEQAQGHADPVDAVDVAELLLTELIEQPTFPRTAGNISIVRQSTVPTFMHAVSIPWTRKSAATAVTLLCGVLKAAVAEFDRKRSTVTVVEPVSLPVESVNSYPIGTELHERITTGSKFVRARLYEPWQRSLFPAVSFDSYSGEYALAELLDKAGTVSWWKRLVPRDKARIAYTVRDNYYPDFVVYDSGEDIHWIVEGKAANKRDDAGVQAKRKATEELVKTLLGDERFDSTRWGYFIAYEDDIAASASWTELKQRADLVGQIG